MKALAILRRDLNFVDREIAKVGWENINPVTKMYRKWVINAITFIQIKHFDRSE